MAEQQYDLFFRGELVDGFYVDFVKADIQSLFKADQAYVDKLFSGQEQAIKTKADKATAIKFQQAFKKAGAKLIVRAHGAPAPISKPATTSKPAPIHEVKSASVNETTAQASQKQVISAEQFTTTTEATANENSPDLIESHQPDIHAPDSIPSWDLGAPGAQIGEESQFIPANVDTSALSVAETGADLIANKGFEEPAPIINVDALSLAAAGSDLEVLDDKPAPVIVDISHLSVE